MPFQSIIAAAWVAAQCTVAPPDTRARVGFVADTQFNTVHAQQTMYRRGLVDSISTFEVAIRPPTLDYSSHYLLRSIVGKLVQEKQVEVIFFLGDGANNGCHDELLGPTPHRRDTRRPALDPEQSPTEGVLTVLRSLRAKHHVPIYFVLGNHDVLGAGNMAFNQTARRNLCNLRGRAGNEALTKLAVMRSVHAFNEENRSLGLAAADRWTYADSWDEPRLALDCGGSRRQHKRRGCFLAATVVDRKHRLEYLLTDSTDYSDVRFLRTAFAGGRGAISWRTRRSQVAWFEDWTEFVDASSPGPLGRVVLSHYPINSFKPFLATKAAHLARLFRPESRLWISAHTHRPSIRDTRPLAELSAASARDLRELNIGSATDYPSYGVAVDLTVSRDGAAVLRKASPVYAALPDTCTDVLAGLDAQVASGKYKSLPRHRRGLGLFGLNIAMSWDGRKKEYRRRRWRSEHDQAVRRNIDIYLGAIADVPAREEAGACIAMYAAILEGIRLDHTIQGDECSELASTSARCNELDEVMYYQADAAAREHDKETEARAPEAGGTAAGE